ncbi:hypothetical protein MRS44_013192 [Fusarium solani]|uniref:uncharacterized protein n=1 Tax=Fusarium solani TaxID=169388 RepID=UPI0032C48573|nr:hypothetical protein MRS44_013192 [Fusarium solani]
MPQSSYTEGDVIQAILDVTENGLSQNQAAQKNGVPPTTLSDRLRGLPSKSEVTQPAQLLSKSEESRLGTWILRQEALGYAPSHSQVRATVAALLRQQERERPIGVHWLTRFIKRHDDIKTKVGKRQEAARFNSFTPMAVNWYFDIRESEYGWIKPENTVNVDEGGIMAGFGLDSLVIGSSDPRRKAFLKGSQSRTWTTFIEAVTADGRLLKPGIIFKGKELQQQWFIDELRGSPTVEWLKEVYLPQTQPADESDARLIILDGHGSHVSDEWMATCFLNNPLDNGVFNVSKAAYRKELQKLASLTDSAPVDKVNFIKAYAKAREVGMTKKNILSGWRVTGNWPISRRKALIHPEIQPDKKETSPESEGRRDGQVDSDNTPKTSRHIRDLGKNKSPSTRRRYSVISKGFEAQESKIASLSTRIASLEEEVGRLSRGKKRKAILNPNKRFMTLAEALVTGETISEANEAIEGADAVEDVIEVGGMEEVESSNSEEEELGVLVHRHLRPFDRTKYDETTPIPKVFQCVEEWSDHIQAVSMQIFRPGSHPAVDECIIRYTGKSDDITVIKGKPDPIGFKIWVISQCGFFIRWIWHVKEKPHGAAGVEISTQESSSQCRSSKRRKVTVEAPDTEDESFLPNSTQAIVVALTNMLPKATYHVFVDNLFSSSPLFRNLRNHGLGATGTARTNSGIHKELIQDKSNDGRVKKMYEFNTVKAIPTPDNQVNQIAWKDNKLMLFLTTVFTGADDERVMRQRKKPSSRKSEAKPIRRFFGDEAVKMIKIPIVAAEYNDQMNHVDRGDQLRPYYKYDHPLRRGPWQALAWTFLLDVALVNSYIAQLHGPQPNWKRYTNQREWRECIYNELFNAYGHDSQARQRYRPGDERDLQKPELQREHIIRLSTGAAESKK